ncbi:acyl-CoA thioesterase YciA [Vibrio astriarenae]|nr:acyl-CoA thioesterase YciA [Vibrio sp. C7]
MPADTNANGDIFGGWIMSQLDLAGGILAKEISCGRIATVSVSSIEFKNLLKWVMLCAVTVSALELAVHQCQFT